MAAAAVCGVLTPVYTIFFGRIANAIGDFTADSMTEVNK
jgi:hypothetical protein